MDRMFLLVIVGGLATLITALLLLVGNPLMW
jgi:hypothetical protein